VILQILADRVSINHDWNAVLFEFCRCSNARQHEQLRRLQRAG